MSQSEGKDTDRSVARHAATPPPRSAPASGPIVPPTPPAEPRPNRSADEIERDIEATRERLAASIDDLAARVHPKAVAQRATDKARLTVVDEAGAPRTGRLAAAGAAVAAVAGIVLWRRRS